MKSVTIMSGTGYHAHEIKKNLKVSRGLIPSATHFFTKPKKGWVKVFDENGKLIITRGNSVNTPTNINEVIGIPA